jgi:hypothetical protein
VTELKKPPTEDENTNGKPERQPEETFDPEAKHGGLMGGGASGPRDIPTGGKEQKAGQHKAQPATGQEEMKNDGDQPDALLSRSSQIGRAQQSGGTPESGRPPDEDSREGWWMPDQEDTPQEWTDPTLD